ncbi:hypothetical protein SEA_GALACTIC_39 [Mycobacterium phage Galactic]|uniref:Uncharacterized protein n=1 Tax=Mycobacterium phage Galactic TaxID=2301612 RepID=A0A385UEP8_9CAUD|nr:hypothetical protein I5H41_gp039 [Mycobacterium phage Galactic]AYB69273.1 hypothetical protein SEA_GALACTIC_39 [Mycobacterium phage Galactic]
MMSADPVRGAIQASLDAMGDGWQVAHYVVVVGLERIDERPHGLGCYDCDHTYRSGGVCHRWFGEPLLG